MAGGHESGKYLFLINIFSKICVLVSQVFLARLLHVDDFGYLLILNVIFGFTNLFSLGGFEVFYIQHHPTSRDHSLQVLRQTFNLRILQNTGLFLLNLVAGVLVWKIMGQVVLGKLLICLSFVHILTLIGKPEETYYSKKLEFKTIAVGNLVRDLSGSLSKVLFALIGLGPFSFVLGQLLSTFSRSLFIKLRLNIGLWTRTSFQKVISYNIIFRFGISVFLNASGSYLTRQIDKVLVSTFFSKYTGGLYQFANSLSQWPFNFIIAPQNPMTRSLMAKNRDRIPYLLQIFRYYGTLNQTIFMPFLISIILMTDILVPLVLGPKWAPSITMFKIFIVYHMFKFINYPANGILTAIGKPEIKARITIVGFIVAALVLFLLTYNNISITYYAIAYVSVFTIVDFLVGLRSFKEINSNYFKFIWQRLDFIYVYIIYIAFALAVVSLIPPTWDIKILLLVYSVAGCLLVYILCLVNRKEIIQAFSFFIRNDTALKIFKKFILMPN